VSVWSIVVAGGSGRRFGGPKQFLPLGGRPVAAWSVEASRSVADGVVLVVPADALDLGRGLGADLTVAGGESRAESVRAGLAVVPDDVAVIVVHDAARPLAGPELFGAVVDAARTEGTGGVVPVLSVSDTLKRTSRGVVLSTVDRDGLVTVQTPQAFDAATLRAAHRSGRDATDDAGLLEAVGATVRTVPGDPRNLKITGPDDLELAEALLRTVPR
jgi:2-C-methyl-D-erythritol 4-phosphate cytidylyltransferase